MLVSPVQVGAPTIAPSFNPPTEQVARDNRVREKVIPPTEMTDSGRERPINSEEKQLKKAAMEPNEHPDDYGVVTDQQYGYQAELEQLVKALSASSYVGDAGELGYSMHIKLPRELLEQLETISQSERTRGVITHKYAQSTIPNPPTEYLVVL